MINHRENTFDQNRVYLNTDIVLTPALTFDVGYVCIYQQRFGRQDFFERHVLRFTLLHKIMLY
jgi:hypothetical protein